MRWTVNILFPLIVGLFVWAGVAGHVSWWTIALIVASHAELQVVVKKG